MYLISTIIELNLTITVGLRIIIERKTIFMKTKVSVKNPKISRTKRWKKFIVEMWMLIVEMIVTKVVISFEFRRSLKENENNCETWIFFEVEFVLIESRALCKSIAWKSIVIGRIFIHPLNKEAVKIFVSDNKKSV